LLENILQYLNVITNNINEKGYSEKQPVFDSMSICEEILFDTQKYPNHKISGEVKAYTNSTYRLLHELKFYIVNENWVKASELIEEELYLTVIKNSKCIDKLVSKLPNGLH